METYRHPHVAAVSPQGGYTDLRSTPFSVGTYKAILDTQFDIIGVNFQTDGVYVSGGSQKVKQAAVATAEIQYATVRLDPTLNYFEIRTHDW